MCRLRRMQIRRSVCVAVDAGLCVYYAYMYSMCRVYACVCVHPPCSVFASRDEDPPLRRHYSIPPLQ